MTATAGPSSRDAKREAAQAAMRNYLVQGKLSFRVGYKLQTRWGLIESVVFALESLGAALFALSLLADDGGRASAWGMVAGATLVAAAVALLFAHLGHPSRAWKAVRNLRTSWVSRGTLVLGGFVGLSALYLAGLTTGMLAENSAWAGMLRLVLLAACVFIPLYPGLVLSSSPAIPFWNSGLLPVLSLAAGVGSAVLGLLALRLLMPGIVVADGSLSPAMAAVMAASEGTARLALAGAGFGWLLVYSVLLALYLAAMHRRGGAARESVRHLLRDRRMLFIGGGCIAGIAVPLVLLMLLAATSITVTHGIEGLGTDPAGMLLATLAALSRIGGDLALRHAFMRVGMFDPVV